jgi:F-box protein 9
MDSRVDQLYRKKYFPLMPPKPSKPNQLVEAAVALNKSAETAESSSLSITDLIAGFSDLSIIPAKPEIEGTPAPPCPIANLPEEILVHIFQDIAVLDVGDFVRLGQVCKRFAYLVASEERIWRRVCLGREFGFGGMIYNWNKGVSWGKLEDVGEINEIGEYISPEELSKRRKLQSSALTLTLLPELYSSSWRDMFRHRPRIRFNGCYISTVNYIRSGQASVNQVTWHSPVHIVTYYRYLRFFRDGTVISLLTTTEPAEVVHHLTKELVTLHQDVSGAHLPSAVVKQALRGRWRLLSSLDLAEKALRDAEGDLCVETEGIGEKYMYKMDLSLRSAGKGTRNNKLQWRSFYSYNKLTDDWGEFALKNDKPFFFSRVKSYGFGY